MTVRNAEFEDMKQLRHIMAVSFRTAFLDVVTKQTLDACAQEDGSERVSEFDGALEVRYVKDK